jgi:very-short-patch-repair endonuclease
MPVWKIEKAKAMRRSPTPGEACLWECLRNTGFWGVRFRRQVPLYGWIADFYCPQRELVIEVDGASHAKKAAQDRFRDACLRRRQIRTLRIPEAAALGDRLGVIRAIRWALHEPTVRAPQPVPRMRKLPWPIRKRLHNGLVVTQPPS